MIEVLFGESEAGAMKIAKGGNLRIGGSDGPTAYFGHQLRQRGGRAAGVPGSKKDVVCLSFMLDIGDIKESVDSLYRQNLICSMYTHNTWQKENMDSIRKDIGIYTQELNRLLAYARQGQSIRIWYSRSPYSLCGLYFLCSLLRQYTNKIFIVKLPESVQDGNVITEYHGWGEVEADKFELFLEYEKPLTIQERKRMGNRWSELREENSPLRAVVNGRLTSVPEEFYDFCIWRCLSPEPVKEARVIGEILGRYPLGISDWWYAVRIEKMIAAGRIRIIEDSDRDYERIICRG